MSIRFSLAGDRILFYGQLLLMVLRSDRNDGRQLFFFTFAVSIQQLRSHFACTRSWVGRVPLSSIIMQCYARFGDKRFKNIANNITALTFFAKCFKTAYRNETSF